MPILALNLGIYIFRYEWPKELKTSNKNDWHMPIWAWNLGIFIFKHEWPKNLESLYADFLKLSEQALTLVKNRRCYILIWPYLSKSPFHTTVMQLHFGSLPLTIRYLYDQWSHFDFFPNGSQDNQDVKCHE